MAAIEIRAAVTGDADAVAGYHARCFATTYAAHLRSGRIEAPDQEGTRRQLLDWFRPESEFRTQVAVVDGNPIGHVTVNGRQLVHLFVEPDHQGAGLGGRLLALGEAMIVAEGQTDLELHARVENLAAIAFYEKAGWVVTDGLIRTVEHGISYDEHILVKCHWPVRGLLAPQVMVLGCGRSGTSIFGELFDALPDFEYHSEPDFELWLRRALVARTAVKVPMSAPTYPADDGLSFPLAAIDAEHPGTEIFWIVRHPLDTISSLRVGIADDWGHHPRPADWQDWAGRSLVERCAHHWAHINTVGYERVSGRATLVTFEDLIADPQGFAATVCARIGVDPTRSQNEVGSWSARVQNTNNDSFVEAKTSRSRSTDDHSVRVGRWRENLTAEEVERASEIVATAAERFGYRLG